MLDWIAFVTLIVAGTLLFRFLARRVAQHRRLLWSLSLLLSFILVGVLVYTVSRSRSFQLFGHLVTAQPTREKVVALTFDDGPTDQASAIVDLQKREQVVGTFFLIGADVERRPDLARMLVQSGHEVGNHS